MKKNNLFYFLCSVFVFIASSKIFAHEPWLLTSHQYDEWKQKSLPEIFSTINLQNVSIVLSTVLVTIGLTLLYRSRFIKRLENKLQFLEKNPNFGAFFLRICTAGSLFIAAFGMIPREGTPIFTIPTLFTPEMQLNLISVFWYWLQWLELILATTFILGIYIRISAAILLLLTTLGLILFPTHMFDYCGFFYGIGIYLMMQGSGAFAIYPDELPTAYTTYLLPHATFVLRLLTGINFIYSAIAYKFLQPNLLIGIFELKNAPTFGMTISTFVFWMAVVELITGILLVIGAFIRPLVCILFALFMLVSALVGENFFAHAFIYGILLTLFWNGPGRYSIDNL